MVSFSWAVEFIFVFAGLCQANSVSFAVLVGRVARAVELRVVVLISFGHA